MNDGAIGVFDSGVGGLTCVRELIKLMPHEDIVYLGDTARVPYGTRSRHTIGRYARQDMAFLKEHRVKMILVACGTVSSILPELEPDSELPEVSGVVIPAAKAALRATKNKRIGVIATSATINSGSYEKACPMFVPLVENGYTSPDCPPTRFFAEEYLACMKEAGVDTLILGCTHYPHLTDVISQVMGEGVGLISSGGELAKYAYETMKSQGLLSDRKENGRAELYCTDSEELFAENVERFLGSCENASISKCSLKL